MSFVTDAASDVSEGDLAGSGGLGGPAAVDEPRQGDDPAAPGDLDKKGEEGAAETDELRERLLRAAAAVFARQGYAGTRIMDIVRESGLSTGAVYGRFGSKNDLLREAVVGRTSHVARLDAGGVGRVSDLAARFVADAAAPLTDDEAVRLEAFVAARREPEVADALAEAAHLTRKALEPLVAAAKRDGTLADDVDPEAAIFLVRILNLGLLLHRGSSLPAPDPDAWRAVVARLLASFSSGNQDAHHRRSR